MAKNERNSLQEVIADAGTGIRIITSELMLLQGLLKSGTTAQNVSSKSRVSKTDQVPPETKRRSDSVSRRETLGRDYQDRA